MSLALVLGGAACVWRDTVAALQLATPDVVIAVNDMISRWPGRLDYAASLHPDKLPSWIAGRAVRGYPPAGQVWSYRTAPHVQRITADWRGSSALFAVKVVLVEARISGAILAGAPLDRTAHFIRPGAWGDAHAFFPGWYDRRKQIAPRLRSMSGWTRQLVGAPTPDWLAGIKAAPPDPTLIALIENLEDNRAAS